MNWSPKKDVERIEYEIREGCLPAHWVTAVGRLRGRWPRELEQKLGLAGQGALADQH